MFTSTHDKIQQWYAKNGRHDLPWRQTNDAYKIYISEIMLQQTQVTTVLNRFYFPFLDKFPTLEVLAKAPLDDVLKAWEGLGYYRRARNLHEAAKSVAPYMPVDVESLLEMKGVGQSTAHAIASFAYKTKVPILDANVKRILYRIFAKEQASEKELWRMAYDFFDPRFPYEFNQALMDIGATICTKKPQCDLCPIEGSCLASDLNPLDFPLKRKKKTVPIKKRNILIYVNDLHFGMIQRTGEFLHGLWGFLQTDSSPNKGIHLGDIIQKYSHFHLHAAVYLLDERHAQVTWIDTDKIEELALSGADHKALELFKKDGLNRVDSSSNG